MSRFSHILMPFFAFTAMLQALQTRGGDWPQVLGPYRNGRATNEQLADSWPSGGPKLVWRRQVGRGFAGVAVQGQRAVVFHRVDDQEIVEALDAATGKTIWKRSFVARYKGQIFPDQDGPLCVPLIHKKQVFVYGAGGDAHALNLADGKLQWSRSLYREFRGRGGLIDYGYFGAGSTPIVADNKLLINVGGAKNHGLVALDLTSGKMVWSATDEGPSYSSPVAATNDGAEHVIFVTRFNCVSVDPKSGDVRFRFPFGKRGPTINGATPIVVGRHLFVSASYGVGATVVQFDASSAKPVWANDEVMSSQYNTCVYRDGYLYGTDGRADVGTGTLRCVNFKTGHAAWSVNDFGIASVIIADDKLLILKDDGKLILAKASPEEFERLASAQILRDAVRALPALAHGKFFARDSTTLKCFQVGE
ncbi:MAG: PQQ-binding-like beta-propeller repeat protein [Pirellulales bacterium]